ncbi:hypothetical protein PUNSTDRAFT_48370 [Punctularia strigosozonata HHB-11173 SS5]|uniref:uncharacterized protein n=1 Tax=Punctularia strigosozonata (strain HHB-11173) TaxID=741275 RepID=UPI0004416E59|nr:uncharacterized protein PUNSTDRAFT_48370 [Punctularia strigosozonata HHB-11173 SS5]EIN13387.1 hypothetical protein PUNSTDRAFT_48370 [Punctularia strigosozonata HHB-11173 SS5]
MADWPTSHCRERFFRDSFLSAMDGTSSPGQWYETGFWIVNTLLVLEIGVFCHVLRRLRMCDVPKYSDRRRILPILYLPLVGGLSTSVGYAGLMRHADLNNIVLVAQMMALCALLAPVLNIVPLKDEGESSVRRRTLRSWTTCTLIAFLVTSWGERRVWSIQQPRPRTK